MDLIIVLGSVQDKISNNTSIFTGIMLPLFPKHTLFSICISCILLCVLSGADLLGQKQVLGYLDMGSNNVSDGPFLKTAGLVTYDFGKYVVGAGFQFDLVSSQDNIFSGMGMNVSREIVLKEFPVQVRGFYLLNMHDGLLRETNWGFLAELNWDHFAMRVGNEFRSFAFTQEALDAYGYQKGERIRENWNLIYELSYHLKQSEKKWNIGIAVTNMDHFLINQETNPMFKLLGRYRVGLPLDLFAEAWYKSAGALNLSVNYFGFFMRTGISWDIR